MSSPENASISLLFLWRCLPTQRCGGSGGWDELEGEWRSCWSEDDPELILAPLSILLNMQSWDLNITLNEMIFVAAAVKLCGLFSVFRTTIPLSATSTRRAYVIALRFRWVDLPLSCTTAWPNSWLTPYRDLSKAMRLTASLRGKTPRTLRLLSKTGLTHKTLLLWEMHTVV